MIPLILFIVMIIIVVFLVAYALLYDSAYEYTDILAIFGAAVLGWVCTLLFSSGNVGDTAYYVSTETTVTNETINESVSSITYVLQTIPVLDNTISVVLMLGSIALSLLTLAFAAKAVMEYFEKEEEFES
jgi:hypothetical protein